MKKKQIAVLITINQVSHYLNRILRVRSLLIEPQEIFPGTPVVERDDQLKGERTRKASIKFRTTFTDDSYRECG